eukprot:COSAG01_NODE_356_length_18316_cov_24.401493_5_plen_87_part_00
MVCSCAIGKRIWYCSAPVVPQYKWYGSATVADSYYMYERIQSRKRVRWHGENYAQNVTNVRYNGLKTLLLCMTGPPFIYVSYDILQ